MASDCRELVSATAQVLRSSSARDLIRNLHLRTIKLSSSELMNVRPFSNFVDRDIDCALDWLGLSSSLWFPGGSYWG